jgi:hypothetical protein
MVHPATDALTSVPSSHLMKFPLIPKDMQLSTAQSHGIAVVFNRVVHRSTPSCNGHRRLLLGVGAGADAGAVVVD